MARDLDEPTVGVDEAPAPPITIAPGTMVGGYRIEGMLGIGGMGQVYAATHPMIGKRVAIKVLLPGLSRNEEMVERFITEARAVNRIGHPNIVDIFAFGQLDDGRHFMVMDLLVGENLRTRVRRGTPHVHDAITIIDQIAMALMAAHDAGIVHRDLKPDNVFLVELAHGGTEVKLLDFGVAKLMTVRGQRMIETQTGAVLGTPAYMAPEQARGAAVDARVDVYALGIMLFELLTGALPFAATTYYDMLQAHAVEVPPPPSASADGLPRELDPLVLAMLDKDPATRPDLATVRDVLRRISRRLGPPLSGVFITPTTIGPRTDAIATLPAMTTPRPQWPADTIAMPPPSGSSRRRRVATVAVLVALTGVAAAVGWKLVRDETETAAIAADPADAAAAAMSTPVDAPAADANAVAVEPPVDASRPPPDAGKSRDSGAVRPHQRVDARPPAAGSAKPEPLPDHRGSGDCDPMRSLTGC